MKRFRYLIVVLLFGFVAGAQKQDCEEAQKAETCHHSGGTEEGEGFEAEKSSVKKR